MKPKANDSYSTARLQQNLAALATGRPVLAKRLADHKRPNTLPTWSTSGRARGLVYRGKSLTSRYDPAAEAARLVAQAGRDGATTAVFFGLGLGDPVRAAIEADCFSQIILFEPDTDLLLGILGMVDLTDILTAKNVHLFVHLPELLFKIPFHDDLRAAVGLAALPGYQGLFPEAWQGLQQRLLELIRGAAVGLGTRLLRQEKWIEHLLVNLPATRRLPISGPLKGVLAGVPAIIVAAGPSLDKNMAELRSAAGRALTISVSTALPKWLAHDMAPGLTIAVEANDITEQFNDLPEDFASLFATPPTVFPALFGLPFARHFTFHTGREEERWWVAQLQRDELEPASGGNVATVAFSLAYLLGCDPLILVGHDLAFGEAGAYHADGVGNEWDGEIGLADNEGRSRPIEVPGYHGEQVVTLPNFAAYLDWYAHNVPRLTATGKTIINATEGGARIHGATQKPLVEVLADLPRLPRDPRQTLADVLAAPPPQTASLDRALREAESICHGLASTDELPDGPLPEVVRSLLEPLWQRRLFVRRTKGKEVDPAARLVELREAATQLGGWLAQARRAMGG